MNFVKRIIILSICGFSGFIRVFAIEGFTHPYDNVPIVLYDAFYSPVSVLLSDTEAGWIVNVIEIDSPYVKIQFHEDNKLYDACYFKKIMQDTVYARQQDIGVVIQNESNGEVQIPIFESAKCERVIGYLDTSYIGTIEDVYGELIRVKIRVNQCQYITGWVNSKYVCGNPYTTCN